jgi:hypothetical protein
MKKSHLFMGTVALLFMACCIIGGSLPMMAGSSTFCTVNDDYQICTDKDDYAPEETVHITGGGFAAGTSLTIKVTRPDGSAVTGDGSFAPWPTDYDTVVVDTAGGFQFDYVLDGITGKYLVEALDGNGTVLASHTFTDARTITSVTLAYGGTTVPPAASITVPPEPLSAWQSM